jgi:hypothetical protein
MTTDQFEADVRAALASRAAEIPAQAAERLAGKDYRPRSLSWRSVAAGTAVAALAAVAGGYLTSAATSGSSHSPGTIIQLDSYQFTLPAGFKSTATPCIHSVNGVPAPGSTRFAAGAAAHGGCVQVVLAAQGRPPATASPITIGLYRAFMVADQPDAAITLYVDIHGSSNYRWLVISTAELSRQQTVGIAAKALDKSHTR